VEPRTWRLGKGLRVAYFALMPFLAGIGALLVWSYFAPVPKGGEPVGLGLALAALAGPVLFLWLCVRMVRVRFTADERGVEVRNAFGYTRSFTWDRVERFHIGPPIGRRSLPDRIRLKGDHTPSAGGIWMELSDGTSARINAITQSNFGYWFGTDTRAEDTAYDLNQLVEYFHARRVSGSPQ
jgi:uncharacterized membrane protein YhdT